MGEDARFEDADIGALRLQALDLADLGVVSALVQDAVFPATEMKWQVGKNRFAVLLNRFRWEDRAWQQGRGKPERVQSLLVIEGVLSVASSGISRSDKDLVCSLLTLTFEPGEDGAGTLTLTLAGDGAIALGVECLDVTLKDVTRPYLAVSKKAPEHGVGEG